MPLTVVICVDHAWVSGGQPKVAIDSALGLKAAGARTIFFSACGPVDERLMQAGVETHCLGQHDMLTNPSRLDAASRAIWNVEAARALGAILATLPRNAIVHVHGWAKALSPAIAMPIRASGLPAVYTMHDYFLHCPNGALFDFQKKTVCPLIPMSLACWRSHCDSRDYPIKLWRNVRQLVAQHVAHLGDAFSDIVLLSDLQREVLAPFLPKRAAIHRVTNPIETLDLGRKDNPASGDFLFVGRLSPEKGTLVFAEAAERAGVFPVFVGDGPMADELRARFPNARLAGWKSPSEARDAMRAARVLVFPSLWYEGLPLTVPEALSLGTPAIVSDVCAARESIISGETGLLFRTGDARDLARALMRLKDDDLVLRMSARAYEDYWRNPMTLARHIEETLAVYEKALARRQAV